MRSVNSLYYIIPIIISLFSYIMAPGMYNSAFCLMLSIVFAIEAFVTLRRDIQNEGFLNFNVLFLSSFFLCTYAFPLFIIGTPSDTRLGVEAFIDYNYAPKCTALSTFAVSLYLFSYNKYRYKYSEFNYWFRRINFGYINILYFFVFIITTFLVIIHIETSGSIAVNAGIWDSIFIALCALRLTISSYNTGIQSFLQYVMSNKFTLATTGFLMLLYLYVGDRGFSISCGLIILAVYHLMIKRVKLLNFMLIAIVGTLFMFVIRETRTGDTSLSSGNASAFIHDADNIVQSNTRVIDYFADLTGIHRELYLGYEYYENNGLLHPEQIILVPFYPLPGIPNLISKSLWGLTADDLKPGFALNRYIAWTSYGHFGIHCVIDVLMRWGHLGVVIFFYLFGLIVGKITTVKNNNVLTMAVYILLISLGIYVARSPLFDFIRSIAYLIIMVWISTRLTKTQE